MPQPTVSAAALGGGSLRELSRPSRLVAGLQRTRALSADELRVANEVRPELDFEPLLPSAVPHAYRLTSTRLVPYCRTLATFIFENPDAHRFQLTEQLAGISFETQFVPGRLPASRVRLQDTVFTIFHGAFDGSEPIDGLNWHENRRVIQWDEGKLICQLELRGKGSPSPWQGLRMAASMTVLGDLAGRARP